MVIFPLLLALLSLGCGSLLAGPGAPVREPTFTGYIKLDDTATWMAMTGR